MDNMSNMSAGQRDQCGYPPCLVLMNTKKFHDDDGYAVEIETRGERTSKGVYFKAKDVANMFKRKYLIKVLTNEQTASIPSEHYKF